VAQFAFLIPYVVAAGGTLLQGASAKGAAGSQALQLEQQAGQERASSQRAAAEQRRSTRYLQSRVQALAAASGSDATDPSMVDLVGDIAGEGEYGALTAMYEGESAARGEEFAASVARKTGKASETASYLKAGSTLLAGASSWYDKYGGGGPSGSDRSFGRAFRSFSRNGLRSSVAQGTAISDAPISSGRFA
jgi:hypothetical protein